MEKMDQKWPALFTCPTDTRGLAKDDLGENTLNPVFSNRAKLVEDTFEGCAGCDMGDAGECSGPVEYRPLVRKKRGE